MRISCSSLFLWDFSIEETVDILARAGIGNIEFWAETPEFWHHRRRPEAVKHVRDVISTLSDQYTVHAPVMDLNASSYNEHVCKATITETKWAIDLTLALGASILTIHTGKRTVQRHPTPEDWERFFDYLTLCTEYANQMGIILALENPTPSVRSMCYQPGEMGEVLARYPELMMTLDIPHALQIDINNAMGFIEDLGDRIVNVHVGGVHDGIPHYPGHLGQNPETTAVLEKLGKSGYDNDLTIEIDDKLLEGSRTMQDKVLILENEKQYLMRVLDFSR